MEVWSWPPSRSTEVNPGKKQKCCSLSCLWSRVQRDTSGPGNSQTLGCLWTKHHRCTCMWNWTETPTVSSRLRAKTVWILLHMSKEIYRLEEGHNLFPLEYRLSAGKPFPQKPRKCCLPETQQVQNSVKVSAFNSRYLWEKFPKIGLTSYVDNTVGIFNVPSLPRHGHRDVRGPPQTPCNRGPTRSEDMPGIEPGSPDPKSSPLPLRQHGGRQDLKTISRKTILWYL